MEFPERYLSSVEKSRFLLISETGADPRVLYRYDPEGGCLLVSRVLDEAPVQAVQYGSVLFTLSESRRPLPAVLGCQLGLCPGSAIWCVPVGVAFFSGGESLLLVEPDSLVCPAFGNRQAASPESWERAARSYAENIAGIPAGSLSFGTQVQAEELVARGLEHYKLRRHVWSRHG